MTARARWSSGRCRATRRSDRSCWRPTAPRATRSSRHGRPAPSAWSGQRTFRRAVDALVDVALRTTALAGTTVADLDLAVLHQANARITAAVGERLEPAAPQRVVDCIAQIGNTTAASLPTALAHAKADGRLQPGSHVLLAAFGAGLAWGGTVLTWGAKPA